MALSEKKYPAFIKPYYPPIGRKSLKLPQPFTLFIKEMLPTKRVLLKDHSGGNFWAVEVAKIGSDFFFQAGWTRFVEDNCLEYGDFIVFQYNGDDEFRFKILRSNSVSRCINVMNAMDFSSNEFVENMEQVVVHEGSIPIDKMNNNISEEERKEEKVAPVAVAEEILIKNSGKRKVRSPGGGGGARTVKIEENSMVGNPVLEGQNLNNKGKNEEDLRSKVDAIQNPCFVANYLKNLTNQVYVPKGFVNALSAGLLASEMVIRDGHGRESTTRFHTRRDKTTWMIGGWRNLAYLNNARYKDCLAFELVSMEGDDQQGSYIQLHIFRAT